jgi:hypothetical protein
MKTTKKQFGFIYPHEPINQMRFRSLEEAKLFFAQQKRLILEKFEPLFDVREI